MRTPRGGKIPRMPDLNLRGQALLSERTIVMGRSPGEVVVYDPLTDRRETLPAWPFLEDLLVSHALAVFNRGECFAPRGFAAAQAVVREVPRERLAALWPARRSRSLS